MLKRIEVANFKSLKRLDYSCAKLNLLMGLNGAGKSSFIQLMLLMRKLAQQPLKAVVSLPGVNDSEKNEDLLYAYADKKDSIAFNISFTPRASTAVCESGKTRDGRALLDWDLTYMMFPIHPKPDEVTPDTLFTVKRLMCIDSKKRQYSFWRPDFVGQLSELPEFKAMNDFLEANGETHESIYLSANDDLKRAFGDIEWKYCEKREALESEINKEEGEKFPYYKLLWRNMKFVEAFRKKPIAVHNGGRHSQEEWQSRKVAFDPEGAWLQVVSPGAQVRIDKQEIAGSERFLQSVAFGRSGHEHEFKPQNVGFGISYVLPVLVALLTSIREDIVIIENPEAHLHPRGQAEMGNLIARAAAYGIQVFVETHSDHVINGVRVAVKNGIVNPEDVNIAFFERKGHEITAEDGTKHKEYYADVRNIQIDKTGSLSEYPEDFMDEWSNQLMRLMKPRKK